ncbi:MAG TPA: DUF6455 family protein [Stellaceae bacterium]|nr:DUF6455 family protein [Stellaceae bacterium]
MSINRRPAFAEARHGLLRRMWSHRLFRRMLVRQGVDLETNSWRGTEHLLFRALDSCSHCREKETCRAWLAGCEPGASYIRFCPSSETIEALRIIAS